MQDADTFIAAIHRDWGEAQGNYDEFRFFTGMRPSEQIALVLSDLDLVNGIISVNKARVAEIDRCQTKTGEDRRVAFCPRALTVLKRQLTLRARLVLPALFGTTRRSSAKPASLSVTCRFRESDGARR